MLNRHKEPYVRIQPQTISLTETYYYRAQVQKFVNFQFEKAEGELKLEFVYDGGSLEQESPKKGSISRRAKNTIGSNGASDQMIHVGHLALRGYKQPNFTEAWPEQQTLRLEIPGDNLREKLDRHEQAVLKYKYEPQEPAALPVQLRNIRLTEIDLEDTNELHSNYDEVLQMEIPLTIDLDPPDVDEDGKMAEETIRHWWRQFKQNKQKSNKADKNEPVEDPQIICLDDEKDISLTDRLKHNLRKLATNRGGYILIPKTSLSDPKLDLPAGESDGREQFLMCALLKAAFQQGLLFVPAFKPYCVSISGEKIYVVPVPMVPPEWYSGRYKMKERFGHKLWIRSPEIKSVRTTEIYDEDEAQDAEIRKSIVLELAKKMSALANTDGGQIFFEAGSLKRDDFFIKFLWPAIRRCQPALDSHLLFLRGWGRDGWEICVQQSSPKVHSVDGVVYHWQDDQVKKLAAFNEHEKTDELYNFIEERCKLDLPTIEMLPVIAYSHLKGPYLDGRAQEGIRYDPQRKMMKWTSEMPFLPDIEQRSYEGSLVLAVNRPVELVRQGYLEGEVHVLLGDKVLSGLDITYFNGLGQQIIDTGAGVTIEKRTKIKLIFDHILLRSVFERREFTASRELEFEGVKPDQKRLEDIQGILADLGLEEITIWIKDPQGLDLPRYEIPVEEVLEKFNGYVIYGSRPDGLEVWLYITGKIFDLDRKRKEGKRTDRTQLDSGRLHIKINGRVEGDISQAQDLSHILNYLQRLLKDRVSHVRVQIA